MEHLYYLMIDGQKCGPFRKDELPNAGIDGDTLVWYEGRDDWIRADKLVLFDELLKEQRQARKRQRKVQRKIAQLPDPENLRKWSRQAIMVNMPAGALYVVGTALLIAAIIVYIVGGSGGPNDPPSRLLTIVTWVLFVAGLLATVVAMVLIGIELGLIAAFTWNCRRIVRVLSPRGDKAQIEVRSFIQDLLDFGDAADGVDFGFLFMILLGMVVVGGPLILIGMCLLAGFFLAFAVIFLVVAGVLIVCAVAFLVPYISLGFSIYRLGFGLNRIINDCKIEAPWAPVTLAFWVALCGLLLLFGPLSVPFFVLAPIWLQKVAVTAVAICEQRIEAAEEPAAPAMVQPSPSPNPVKDASDQFMG